jgi:hypothetical protein
VATDTRIINRRLSSGAGLPECLVLLFTAGRPHSSVQGNHKPGSTQNGSYHRSLFVWDLFDAFHLHLAGISGDRQWATLLVTVIVFPYILYHRLEKPIIRRGEKAAVTLRTWLEAPLRAAG